MFGWTGAISEYLETCEYQKGLNLKTLQAYKTDLEQFRDLFSDNASEIKKTDISGYIVYLNKNYRPKTIKRKLASVKAYFNYLEHEEYITKNPFSKLIIKIRDPFILPRVIPLNDIKKILLTVYNRKKKHSPDTKPYMTLTRDIAVLELLFATGIRVSELCGLLFGDINLDERYVRIMGKGSRERIIQIANPDVIEALNKYKKLFFDQRNTVSHFFINRLNNQLSPQSVRFMINKHAKAASLQMHITPHMFRHSFATLLLEEDVDIRYIQHLLGHSSIITTQIYTHITDEKQREILTTKHPRNRITMEAGLSAK